MVFFGLYLFQPVKPMRESRNGKPVKNQSDSDRTEKIYPPNAILNSIQPTPRERATSSLVCPQHDNPAPERQKRAQEGALIEQHRLHWRFEPLSEALR